MIETCLNNAPLCLALAVAYWKATPYLVKSTLLNGGGEIVKRIVREANAEQSLGHAEDLAKVRERLARVEAKLEAP